MTAHHSETAWAQANAAEGVTDSERYLVRLARRTFLSLWSYSNLYTDEGLRGTGDGKELSDFMVVFGNHVLLFSDKECEFSTHPDIKVAWYRWYRRAIEKSAKQLAGAESWITRFPERIFLDPKCQQRLPLDLPSLSDRIIHLIAVTRGSALNAAKYWGGGSSGSLLINTSIHLEKHKDEPFHIGWPLPNRRFVHVFDEVTLDIVLQELDTVSDFVGYLSGKEEYLSKSDVEFSVAGEEELVAAYFMRMDHDHTKYCFPDIASDVSHVMHLEGDWSDFKKSTQYEARRKANERSYLWDQLIEYQSSHIIKGTAQLTEPKEEPNTNYTAEHELVMRAMAEERRVTRRGLADGLFRALSVNEPGKRFVRTVSSLDKRSRAYVFLTISNDDEHPYEEYRDFRRSQLIAYCEACRVKLPGTTEVVGIASEPFGSTKSSQEFILMRFDEQPMSKAAVADAEEFFRKADMWNPKNMTMASSKEVEFPIAFSATQSKPAAMNRSKRRDLAKKQRRRK